MLSNSLTVQDSSTPQASRFFLMDAQLAAVGGQLRIHQKNPFLAKRHRR